MARGRDRGLRGPDDVEYAVSEEGIIVFQDTSYNELHCSCGASIGWHGPVLDAPEEWRRAHAACAERQPPVVEFTPTRLLADYSDAELDALPDTDEVRLERARRREELAATPADLLKFFTRREKDWWRDRDSNKYVPHTGAQQMLRASTGMSRREAREAVLRFHRERAEAQRKEDENLKIEAEFNKMAAEEMAKLEATRGEAQG